MISKCRINPVAVHMLEILVQFTPTWLVFILTIVGILCVTEVGFRLGKMRAARFASKNDQAMGIATGAILGLVSFLLAFTFGIAASQNNDRRVAVLAEANAIGTAFLRSGLLPQEEGEEMAQLLRDYVVLRATISKVGVQSSEISEVIAGSEQLHDAMWQIAATVAKSNPSAVNALVLASLNDVFDLHSERVVLGLKRRIPLTIWIALFTVAAIGVGALNYRYGFTWQERSDMMPALVLAFAGVITLIADLDNPQFGFLRNDQSPIVDLARSIVPGYQ